MIEQYDGRRNKRQQYAALFATIAMSMCTTTACYGERDSPVPPESTVTVTVTEQAPASPESTPDHGNEIKISTPEVILELGALAVKQEALKAGYSRAQFDTEWNRVDGCDIRDIVLIRDLTEEVVDEKCEVQSGKLDDPYTGGHIDFIRGTGTSGEVPIDHIVALGDAWQKGAQQWKEADRETFANDTLNLQATSLQANSKKQDGDFDEWQPSNGREWCRYVARQIHVKAKYKLWVTNAEHKKMSDTLRTCPNKEFSIPN